MILTVTANASLDRVLFIPELIPGANIYTERVMEAVGGKGYDAAVACRGLGADCVALGFVAGLTGRQLVDLLDGYGIHHDLIWMPGDTRIAHVIIESRLHRDSHITTNNGYTLDDAAMAELLTRYRGHLLGVRWVVAAGSLPGGAPPDFYAQITAIAKAAGVPILVDCFGEPMQRAIQAGPTIAKMNRSELARSFGVSAANLVELAPAVRALRDQHGVAGMIITAGGEGILGVTPDGDFLAVAPHQNAVNAAGAGDATSAALAWRLEAGDPWPEALRWAAATGAASTLTERTGECRRADVELLYPLVSVQPLEGGGTAP